jgi:hypothetical protein
MKHVWEPSDSIPFPSWAQEAIQLYESNAASQFILYENDYDQRLIPSGKNGHIGTLTDFHPPNAPTRNANRKGSP